MVERFLHWYGRAYGLGWMSLRYFNAAGADPEGEVGEEHDPETHLIPIALAAASGKREQVEIYGDNYPTRDGTCVRDYIHVVDLARAHILALAAIDQRSRIYNLGCGGEGYSVRDVIRAARKITGKEVPVQVGPRRTGDPATLVASSAKIRHELGWKALQDLEVIIESAWRWMLAHPDGYESKLK